MSDAHRTAIPAPHQLHPPLTSPGPAEANTGRAWGYVGALLGGLVSIGANTAHSYVPPVGAPSAWRPPVGAVVGAVFWPVALFVAIEILARTLWPDGAWWILVRFAGLLPVAVVAAIVSYNHLSALLGHYGEDRLTTVIGPLAVDGLMVMSSAAVIATSPRRSPVVLSAEQQAPSVAPWVSAPPTPATEIIRPDKVTDSPAIADTAVPLRTRGLVSGRTTRGRASRTVRRARTRQQPATPLGQPGQAPDAGQASDTYPAGSTAASEARRRLDTRPVVAAMRATYPDMAPDTIADKLGVTERTVRRHLSAKEATR